MSIVINGERTYITLGRKERAEDAKSDAVIGKKKRNGSIAQLV